MKNEKKYKVSVVMPNLNGEKLLEKNLPKLIAAKGYASNEILEIIIIDDGSWDGSVSFLKKNYPDVKLIRHTVNRGFSAAVNTGVRAAKGDLILLINTDVIPNTDFLVKVIPGFKDKSVFAISLHEKGFGSAKGTFVDGYIQLAMGDEGNKNHPSFYVSGGSGVFRRSIWIELGGMDEKLLSPFYWEDIDLCYRAAKRGYKLLWEPDGVVEHHHESTISKFPKDYVARVRERNQLLMLWKNVTSPNLTRKHVAGLFTRLIKHPGYLRIVFMALGRIGIVTQRRKREIKESRVSDEVIFARYAQ
jgi:GT2 family glycosyltransferase